MSIHKGHRGRMRERFLKSGLDSFSEHEVLEILLYHCIPRGDTNPIAHRLINRFGSLVQVIEAPVEELEKVEGMGPASATFISLLQQTYRRIGISKARENVVLTDVNAYGQYLQEFFFGKFNEMVYLLCLDAKGMVIDCYEICEGGIYSTSVPTRKIVETAMRSNAVSVVLAHNHPGGFAVPSLEDREATIRLAKALYAVDIVLVDHVVVAGRDFISMQLSRMYNYEDVLNEE